MFSANGKMVHLFHWPSFREYQERLLRIISRPVGARGEIYYAKKWVNKTFVNEIKNINETGKYKGVFWVLSCKEVKQNEEIIASFDFTFPLRFLTILKTKETEDYYFIDFITQEYIGKNKRIDSKGHLNDFFKIAFGSSEIPYPGVENGFLYVGPKVDVGKGMFSIETLYKDLENIPCSLRFTEGIKIKDYPLIKIEEIEKSKLSESGVYKLSMNRAYKIALTYYQGEPYRSRSLKISGIEFFGKSDSTKIPIEGGNKNQDKIDIKIECDKIGFTIPLGVEVVIPIYKRRIISLLILLIISFICLYLFNYFFPDSDNKTKSALIIPLIVLLLNKIWDLISKTA